MNSIELAKTLHKKGYLSKEAAVRVLRERDKLVKEALYNEAYAFFKVAGFRDFFKNLSHAGKNPLPVAKGVTPKPPGWSDVGSNLTKILALAGLTSASAAGIEALQDRHSGKKLQKEIERSYSRLTKEQPRIAEMDQDKVRGNFDVLARFAPSLAANATVAAAFVASQGMRNLIEPATIKTLAETQSKIDGGGEQRGSHRLPFNMATGLAQSAMSSSGG